jgi:hypothetical protein
MSQRALWARMLATGPLHGASVPQVKSVPGGTTDNCCSREILCYVEYDRRWSVATSDDLTPVAKQPQYINSPRATNQNTTTEEEGASHAVGPDFHIYLRVR